MIHGALYSLPDVTLAVEAQTLRILDVNRSEGAFGYSRQELGAIALDTLLDRSQAEVHELVAAPDGRVLAASARLRDGNCLRVSARASPAGGASSVPCTLVVLREEHGIGRDDAEQVRRLLHDALARLSSQDGNAMPVASSSAPPQSQHHAATGGSSSQRPPALTFSKEGRRHERRGTVAATGEHLAAPLPFKPPEVPDLTIEQYAALTVELEASPDKRNDTFAMYGIGAESTWQACQAHWTAILHADPATSRRWMKLVSDFRTKLVKRH